MYARKITIKVTPEKINEVIRLYEESVVPESKHQEGYRGMYVLSDKEVGKLVSLTFWDCCEYAAANEESGYYQRQIEKFRAYFIEPPVKEGFDVDLLFTKSK
jgi:heme-degrading monooxygenase HmoA